MHASRGCAAGPGRRGIYVHRYPVQGAKIYRGGTKLLRFVPTIVGLIAFGLMTILYLYDAKLYLSILQFVGIDPWSYPFIDGEFMYAMKHCWIQGVDVYQSVPCDVVPG